MRAEFSLARQAKNLRTGTHPSWDKVVTYKLVETANEIIKVVDSVFENIRSLAQKFTKFSFQHWVKEQNNISATKINFSVYLPFKTTHQRVPYTSNVWNNPYFENVLIRRNLEARKHAPWKWTEIHQPLQEALNWLGIRCYPDLGEPIQPVKWPKAPNTFIEINLNDLVRIIKQKIK